MPRIQEVLLNSIIYLYPSVQEAQDGDRVGGSGFIIGVPSETFPKAPHLYAVTNKHVIEEGASVIRLCNDDILPLDPNNWIHHPAGDDLAICAVEDINGLTVLMRDFLVTKEYVEEKDIGVGDEVLFIGRFMGFDGKETNIPTVRFGNISIMPARAIRQEWGHLQESILVEARSLAGYSGSPVFFYEKVTLNRRYIFTGFGMKLLGIDWGHLPHWETVYMNDQKTVHPNELKVCSNSGMMGIVPAWKLDQLLDIETVRKGRAEREARLLKERPSGGVLD